MTDNDNTVEVVAEPERTTIIVNGTIQTDRQAKIALDALGRADARQMPELKTGDIVDEPVETDESGGTSLYEVDEFYEKKTDLRQEIVDDVIGDNEQVSVKDICERLFGERTDSSTRGYNTVYHTMRRLVDHGDLHEVDKKNDGTVMYGKQEPDDDETRDELQQFYEQSQEEQKQNVLGAIGDDETTVQEAAYDIFGYDVDTEGNEYKAVHRRIQWLLDDNEIEVVSEARPKTYRRVDAETENEVDDVDIDELTADEFRNMSKQQREDVLADKAIDRETVQGVCENMFGTRPSANPPSSLYMAVYKTLNRLVDDNVYRKVKDGVNTMYTNIELKLYDEDGNFRGLYDGNQSITDLDEEARRLVIKKYLGQQDEPVEVADVLDEAFSDDPSDGTAKQKVYDVMDECDEIDVDRSHWPIRLSLDEDQ